MTLCTTKTFLTSAVPAGGCILAASSAARMCMEVCVQFGASHSAQTNNRDQACAHYWPRQSIRVHCGRASHTCVVATRVSHDIGRQMTFSILLDVYGLFSFPKRGAQALKLGGIAMIFVGAVAIQLLSRRDAARVRPALQLLVMPAVLSITSIRTDTTTTAV